MYATILKNYIIKESFRFNLENSTVFSNNKTDGTKNNWYKFWGASWCPSTAWVLNDCPQQNEEEKNEFQTSIFPWNQFFRQDLIQNEYPFQLKVYNGIQKK